MEIEDRNLVGVEYPGRVENADNMVKTLGGLTNISKVICNMDKKRLDLTFRPDDVFAKPIYGDLKPASGLLLKVVYRRRRRDIPGPSTEEEETNDEPKIDVIGVIRSMFKFDGLCDYQYLPIGTNLATHKAEFIYDDIMPNGLLSPDWLTDDANNDIPYFFPPPSFTRVDTPQDSFFKKDRSKGLNKDQSSPFESAESTIIGMSRTRRFKHACYIPFSLTNPIPEKAQFQALKMLKFKFITNEQFNMIKEYLDRQPIWLRSSLAYETKIPRQKLKIILPSLAYYFTTGPWRLMWVRFGYDPRKDFTSRYYQTLDYRIRSNTLKEKIARSRKTKTEPENIYPYFEVDRLPETRQSFYRYCDVHVPKIQEMLDKIPTPLSGAICNEKTGWLPPNFDDNCREILTETINELLEMQPADFDPNQLASTSRAALAQSAEQAENEWEYGDDEEGYDDEERDQTYLDYEDEE
ncbi:general transcription factor 3C polypeptide 5-like [Contarinia nasturtii]|uniref:general transcription factor 3C polypeptide 5-like n=1 Tax=Contarinia nasturtii TaxID=265458 RepID=UPI0012D4810E|nr:general transcription factor 3C polypeptide 5-like [Contarinia nasturtii]